jgi:hypothetical protein
MATPNTKPPPPPKPQLVCQLGMKLRWWKLCRLIWPTQFHVQVMAVPSWAYLWASPDSGVLRYVRDINNSFIEFSDECLNLSISHTNKEGKAWLQAWTIMIPSLKATQMHHKIHFAIMFVLWLKLFLNCERWETQDARSGHAHIMVYMVKQPTNHLGWLIPFI